MSAPKVAMQPYQTRFRCEGSEQASAVCKRCMGKSVRHQALNRSPAKEPLEEQVLGPHNAVDGLVWRVTDGTHRVCFGGLLGLALKALSLSPHVYSSLHINTSPFSTNVMPTCPRLSQ